jgi:hypothetical protein
MKRSDSARVKSFLIFRRKRQPLTVEIAEACLLEKSLATIHLNGEPELPKEYRHIRSAIGALLILARDCNSENARGTCTNEKASSLREGHHSCGRQPESSVGCSLTTER